MKKGSRRSDLAVIRSGEFRKGLVNHEKVEKRLRRELEAVGFDFDAFWESPMETLEQITILRMTRLLMEERPSAAQLRAIEVAYKIYPLAAVAQLRTQGRAVNEFREKYRKREGNGEVVDIEAVEEPT